MSTVDNLKSILIREKEVLSSLETEIINIETSDLITENQNLKTELVKYGQFLEREKDDNLKISEQNKNLRNALYEQFYNEKVQIFNSINHKKPNVFSLGITSGGVAILYVILALSFFKFGILDMYSALVLCVFITLGTFILSQRYNSQTISAFAMIGGYLPIFSIVGNKTIVYGAMIYFVILNMLALVISVNRKWTVTTYIGFVLNVAGSIYISDIVFFGRFSNGTLSIDDFITILYIVFAFIIYTLIPIIGSFRKKLSFKNTDVVLLAMNTLISTVLLYSVFYIVDLWEFASLLAIDFAIVYLTLGKFVEKFMRKEQKVRALFYITGFIFIVLIIPFQFGKVWLSLGW